MKILTVCVGNICRSPVAEAILSEKLPDYEVASAGIGALVGSDVDPVAREVAEAAGVVFGDHAARQFTRGIGEQHDLILVLEGGHKREIERIAPELSGRVMRLTRWNGDADIPDPYRKSKEYHEYVFTLIQEATAAWLSRLLPKKSE
ncbi:low molecular weight phosphotyrosine protein phosphatase [Yoonia sp.]|uniref:low molecular weight protein-tyrosine-phosphatase n=1 Tax=Yoonia sp. TaxID=2212373 RepID=UPI00232B6813|nr:low molecular weight protein-tyrosine-phosphatase [Yoonia sp.]MDB4240796.1 low molecular weight phosphotyrosine protein phosphatase [Yoonia sp.]